MPSPRLVPLVLTDDERAVSRIWRAFGLRPHLVQSWRLSTDPQFIDKVRDIVGLYLDPPAKALVLCVDEKSQIQALNPTAPCLPILPTTPARRTHDYVRNGTTSLFAAFEAGSGSVIAQPYRQHRHQELIRFLKLTDGAVPKDTSCWARRNPLTTLPALLPAASGAAHAPGA